MIIWPGLELIGRTRGLGKKNYGIEQGVMYTVKRVGETNLTLEMTGGHREKDAVQDLEQSDDEDAGKAKQPSPHEGTLPHH